jgi:multisubunit Na+/H+ antiporter MnhE subunit
MIITTTPGTVSAGIDQERGDILVHALSTDNAELIFKTSKIVMKHLYWKF